MTEGGGDLGARSPRMRILIVDHHGTVVGGSQTYQRAVMAALQRRGHDVALLHQCRLIPGEVLISDECSATPRWCTEDAGIDAAIQGALAWRPDVLYVQGLDPELEDVIVGTRPSVLYAHNYYGTCATGTKHTSRPSPRACERTFGPACLALNYALGCGLADPRALLRSYRAQSARLGHLERYDAVLVASKWMEAEYLRHGVRRARLHRLPHFPATVIPDRTPPRERASDGRILFAGRLTRVKGGAVLVDAMALAGAKLARALTLVVAGDGPERTHIEAQARAKGLATEFFGWVDAAEVKARMRDADLLAVPSLWPEPFGLVGIEAGALGLPAVGFATGGIPDWLRPGESGELADADPPTAEKLAAAIVRAIGDEAHLAKLRLGAMRVAAEYTLDNHLDGLERILLSVVQNEQPSPPRS